jgi:hypothetical protein
MHKKHGLPEGRLDAFRGEVPHHVSFRGDVVGTTSVVIGSTAM